MRGDIRRLPSGYSNLGPIQIPPRPQAVVLTDRDNGQRWLVSFNSGAPIRLSIIDQYSTIQRLEGVRQYDVDSGPVMDDKGEIILILRHGNLGLEYTPNPVWQTDRDDPPEYARKSGAELQMFISTQDISTVHLGLII